MKFIVIMISFLISTFTSVCAYSADGNAALYDVTAPADSAFIRVFNSSDASVNVKLSAKTEVQPVSTYQLGDYLFASAGQYQLTVGAVTSSISLDKNEVITFVYDGATLTPINDDFYDGLKKAQISFYNLTSQTLSLKTVNGKHAVVKDVQPGKAGSRKVNEVKMAFAVFNEKVKAAEFESKFLKKGRSYSYVVVNKSGLFDTILVANKVSSVE